MQDMLELDQLSLDHYRRHGKVPKDSLELRRRIQDHGVIDPVVVRPLKSQPGRYEILSNPEIYIAAGKLGLTKVPVVVRDDLDETEADEIIRAQHASVKGNPISEAEWFQDQLSEQREIYGKKPNIARLARLTGRSRSQVSRLLALLTLPLEVQEHFRAGRLSAAHGRFLAKLKDPGAQKQLAARAVKEGLSVRDLEGKVNSEGRAAATNSIPAKVEAKKDADTLRLERELTALVGSPVEIDHGAGKLTVNYFGNFETLEGVLEKLGYRAG
jgi:ParB family chromosome partitioning protein